LSDIADIAALSPFHAIRVFRLTTGYTPAAMQTALRIQQAKRLLASERASVTDTCFTVGFSSLGSFSQRFLALTAVNPSDYRTARERADHLAEALARLQRAPLGSAPEPHTISGSLIAKQSPSCLYFVGLFPPGPPQGRPIRGDVLDAPGEFVIRHVPDGIFAIYSAAIEMPRHPLEWVMPDTESLTGGGQLVEMRSGMPVQSVKIELRPRSTILTPVLTTLMAIPGLDADARRNHELRR
jgi:AraC-like DNA-binding protein